jgi:hypothetical protein
MLPFLLPNGSVITISMMLCKFEIFVSKSVIFFLLLYLLKSICLFKAPPSCTDNIRNQDGTDIDCGGLICARRCNINQACAINVDCNDAICVMNTCLGNLS